MAREQRLDGARSYRSADAKSDELRSISTAGLSWKMSKLQYSIFDNTGTLDHIRSRH